MVQQFKCRLGYNGAASADRRWRLCACVNSAATDWTYNCKLQQQRQKEMGILSDNKRDTTFLAKDDCPGPGKAKGMLATIVSFEMVDLNPNGRHPENKPILKTKEHSAMVLNPTNRDWLLDRFGDDQRCIGKTVLIWHDPDVEYPRGTKVGGLRIADATEYRRDDGRDLLSDQDIIDRENKRRQAQESGVPFDDDIPFGD